MSGNCVVYRGVNQKPMTFVWFSSVERYVRITSRGTRYSIPSRPLLVQPESCSLTVVSGYFRSGGSHDTCPTPRRPGAVPAIQDRHGSVQETGCRDRRDDDNAESTVC